MVLNTLKCDHLTPLGLKELNTESDSNKLQCSFYLFTAHAELLLIKMLVTCMPANWGTGYYFSLVSPCVYMCMFVCLSAQKLKLKLFSVFENY